MDRERRDQRAQIDEVKIERLRVGNERQRRDILQEHRWDEQVLIAWNDDLNRMRGIRFDAHLVPVPVKNGERDRARNVGIGCSDTAISRSQSIHDGLEEQGRCILR